MVKIKGFFSAGQEETPKCTTTSNQVRYRVEISKDTQHDT